MKKKVLVGIIFLLIIIPATLYFINNKTSVTADEKKFKQEYVSLNNKKATKTAKEYLNIAVESDNDVTYINSKEVIKKLKKGTSVIYLGFPKSNSCRNLVPILIETAKEYQMPLYYFNASSIRDTKYLDNENNIVTNKKGTKDYYEILSLLDKYVTPYEGLNDDNEKRLYFPTVIFIKDGKVIGVYTQTTEEKNNSNKKLTTKEKKELVNKLEKLYDEISSGVCAKEEKC